MTQSLLADLRLEFQRFRDQGTHALTGLTDEQFFARPGEAVNSIALIVKHLAGNFRSRWTDFLATDGEKPGRNRDGEFVLEAADTRVRLMLAWEEGWQVLFNALDELTAADLSKVVAIRGESHTVQQAVIRGLTHAGYHLGQILYVARLLSPKAPWITIAPGQSQQHAASYLGSAKKARS